MAREFFTAVDLHGNPLKHVPLPVDGTDAVNKDYVDAHAGGGGGTGDVPSSRTLTAGNGLVGGGDLSINRTFDVGSGTGITVTANAVAVDTNVIQARSERGAVNGYVPLDASGLIPTVYLPPLAVNDVFTVASQAAMLALTAQPGDMAIRTDNGKTYVLAAAPAAVLGNWKEIMATGQVVSVNGQTGVVSITAASLSAASSTTQVVAGAGLTGGGALTGNITLNAVGDATLNVSPDQISVVSAPKWTTPRSITLTGDATGSATLDGSANVTLATTVTGGAGGMTEAQADALFLKPSEILAGSNVTVSTASGAVTISSTGAAADHTHPDTVSFQWTYDSVGTMTDPGLGKVRTDTAAGVPSTQIAFSDITEYGIDASGTLAGLTVGDMIAFQETANANNWGRYRVTVTPTDNASWWLVPVEMLEMHGAAIAKNQDVLVRFTYGTGGGGGSGTEVDEVYVGPTAPPVPFDGQVWINLEGAGNPNPGGGDGGGTAGSVILDGTGAPADVTGNVDNYYLDTAAQILYGPKAAAQPAQWVQPTLTNFPVSGTNIYAQKHRFLAAGTVTGIRIFVGSASPTTGYEVYLWSGAGALLASKDADGLTLNAWNTVTLDSPVPVTAATTYVAGLWYPSGAKIAFQGSFAGQTSGDVVMIAYGVDGPCALTGGTRDVFPPNDAGIIGMGVAAVFAATEWPVALRSVPPGGTTGQTLSKTSATDYAAGWASNTFPSTLWITADATNPSGSADGDYRIRPG